MKLHGKNASRGIFRGGKTAAGHAGDLKTGRQGTHMIAMAHPDFQTPRQAGKKRRPIAQIHFCGAVFASFGAFHLAAQRV